VSNVPGKRSRSRHRRGYSQSKEKEQQTSWRRIPTGDLFQNTAAPGRSPAGLLVSQTRTLKQALVSVTFTEVGTLGLKMAADANGRVEIRKLHAGTQALRHSNLVPGLLVHGIQGESVIGKDYPDVIATLNAAGRPLTMTFQHPNAVVRVLHRAYT
jgi:hypothetical protein